MDEYRYQQRRYKRGDNCIISFTLHGVGCSRLCGCGTRIPPEKKYKTRIVKRTLKRNLRKDIEDLP